MTGVAIQSVSKLKHKPGQVRIFLKGGFCCQQMVCKKADSVLDWMHVSNRWASFLFFSRANAPKLNFGGSAATQATGITGGFGFGSSVPTSVPSSQAAAPSGFVFGSAGTTTTTTTAQSGTTGTFTFSSGTTTQAGTPSFNIGTAAPQAAPTGLTFGTAPAAAATTAATLGAATQSTTPFCLGGQSAGACLGLTWQP